MKVLLIFPPGWSYFQPTLGLPILSAFLRQQDINVVQKDLNIEFYDQIFSFTEIKKADAIIQKKFKQLKSDTKEYEALLTMVISGEEVASQIEKSKEVLKSPDFYNLQEYLKASNYLKMAELMYLAAYHFQEFISRLKGERWAPGRVEEVLSLLKSAEWNLSALGGRFHMVGISVIDIPQVIPALRLAKQIKKENPETHIVIGGNIFLRWKEVLFKRKELFDLIDSVIINEGEHALLELINQVSGKKKFDQVPNLIYKEGDNIKLSPKTYIEDINQLPTPDFDGFLLEKYLSPKIVLPVYASRGCYWNKCAFCDHGYGYPEGFRVRKPEKVVEDIKTLSEKYKTDSFIFNDELLSPKMAEAISEKITENKLDVRWSASARLEDKFKKPVLDKMFSAGCRVIYWGLESASGRVLNLMDKGIKMAIVTRVLKDSSNAGIWNHLFVFFGFPGETTAEVDQTMNFVFRNQNIIQTIGCGPFQLNRFSKLMDNQERFGVRAEGETELSIQYHYTVASGIIEEEANHKNQILNDKIRDESNKTLIWGALTREHYFLYLTKYGKDHMQEMAEVLKCKISRT